MAVTWSTGLGDEGGRKNRELYSGGREEGKELCRGRRIGKEGRVGFIQRRGRPTKREEGSYTIEGYKGGRVAVIQREGSTGKVGREGGWVGG